MTQARQRRRRAQHEETQIRVYFEGEDDLPILFANHIFVRATPDGFLVSFAQSHGPYETSTSTAELAEKGVPAKIISRLLIPHARMGQFAKIFADQAKSVSITEIKDVNDAPTS